MLIKRSLCSLSINKRLFGVRKLIIVIRSSR
jgi:hypothetical protein